MSSNEGVDVETLFVACTRPTTILWVPFSAVIVEIMVVIEIFIFTRNIFMLGLFIPTHGIFYLLTMKEPRKFELIRLWLITKFETFLDSYKHWRSSTYSPLSIHVGRDQKYFQRNKI
ncbi:MAG: VirB3 family type IV secretion system protein [Burkholderiales bacterium]